MLNIYGKLGMEIRKLIVIFEIKSCVFLACVFLYACSFIGDVTLVFFFPARFGRNFWLKSWIDGRSAVWCPKKLVCLLGTCEKSLAGGIVLWCHDG